MYVQFSPFFLRFFFPKNVEGVAGGTRTKERCYYYRFLFLKYNKTQRKKKKKWENEHLFFFLPFRFIPRNNWNKKEYWTYTSPYMNNLSVYIIIDVGSKKKRKKEKKIK